jgi:hypothetical protein
MRRPTDVYIGLMRDGSAIAAATSAAAIAVRDGDLAAARVTLSGVLGAASGGAAVGVPLDTAGAFDADVALDVAEAASLYARVLAASGCPRDGVAYAASVHQRACQVSQPGSDLRLRAAATYAYQLRATGDLAAAMPVGRDLARQLVARFGATDRRTLAAHGDLAVTLHAAGECLTGRQILHRTGELVRSTYGPGDPLGTRMRDRLADLTRQCRPPEAVGAERPDTVADHTCGQPDAAASISIADLFGDLFAGEGQEVIAQPPDEAADPTKVPPAVADRPAIPSAGLLVTLGVAIPTARPPAPAALLLSPPDGPTQAAEVPAPAEVAGEPSNGPSVGPSAEGSVDPHVVVELPETAEMVATAGHQDSTAPDAFETATTADDIGDPSPTADVGGIDPPESGMPPRADRPTAGFPTVPIAVVLHPTWVAVPPERVSAPRPIGETSTVGVAGSSVADLPVTHSRATFGRIRRLSSHAGAGERPQRTATTGSARAIEGE